MSNQNTRTIHLSTVANLRDMGGLPLQDGVFRPGELYRSATLAKINMADAGALKAREIKTVFDFRTQAERTANPDRLDETVTQIHLDVLADSPVATAAHINDLFLAPEKVAAYLGEGQGEAALQASYRDIITTASATKAYRGFFSEIANPNRSGAALFHCTTGKDRTGWAAAALLTFLGATEETIMNDYMQTNADLLPTLQPLLDKVSDAGIDPNLILPILGVKENYLQTAFTEMKTRYGSIGNYLTSGLRLDESTQSAIRERFVQN